MLPPVVRRVEPVRNRFFIIEPFDQYREERKSSITEALRRFYGETDFSVDRADQEIVDLSLFNGILRKIVESMVCVVDLTGRRLIIATEAGTADMEVVYSPNVVLELGIALALRKPCLLVSRKVDGKVQIPADLTFTRYIGLTELDNWSDAADKIEATIRQTVPGLVLGGMLPTEIQRAEYRKYLVRILGLRESYSEWSKRTYHPVFFAMASGHLVAAIDDAPSARVAFPLEFRVLKDELEEPVGWGDVYFLQSDGRIQARVLGFKEGTRYLTDALDKVLLQRVYVPGPLDVIIVPRLIPELEYMDVELLTKIIEVLPVTDEVDGGNT